MHTKNPFHWILIFALLAGFCTTAANVQAAPALSRSAQSGNVTAYELIIAMNTLRMSYGLVPMSEDPIINAVAQSTAEIMAANQMSWHIGDVSGRLTAAGFGGGSKVWATENFAVGTTYSLDEIMVVWSDASHMIPAVNPAYCRVGAGVATSSNGMTYYVLQAAYTAGATCGEYKPPAGLATQPEGSATDTGFVPGVPQIIVPVKIATPDSDGKIFHVAEAGQSFWSIAVAYKITIKDLQTWNNISKDAKLQIGQRLFIPGSNTAGYATPTPVGMIQLSTPDKQGKIIHVVQAYQTLSTIGQAYKVSVNTILALNSLQAEWPLQIGQKLVIHGGNVTPSPTPRPLTPIEKLTPESDGKYYHVVQSGESLSWIADLYKINVNDLMTWNDMNAASVLHPKDKLVLQVTPPATATPTLGPPTPTPTATKAPPSPTPSLTPTMSATAATPAVEMASMGGTSAVVWFVVIGLLAGGGFLFVAFSRKKQR